ncbi:MAG: methyltransferase domain-containing protein [Pseudomonadota bacterium]|nr:methyltransferase domain-containing protein [Pseudomonadota bacterium]
MNQQAILDYYKHSHIDYLMIWGTFRNFALHYGYHDQQHKTHHAAVLNMNREVARRAGVQTGDKVLDAGCGIGGTSIWMAQNCGTQMTAINISDYQVDRGERLVKKLGLENQVRFVRRSFTDTGLPDESFDAIFGMESISYAEDKRDFLREAYRLLKPGGRLVVTDGFQNDIDPTPEYETEYQQWLDGWAVPNLWGLQQFQDDMTEIGFRDIEMEDAYDKVLPSSRRMYLAAKACYAGAKLLQWMRIRNQVQTGNVKAAKLQYVCLTQRKWIYGIIRGVK